MTTYRVIDLMGYEQDTPEVDELMGYGVMAEDGDSMTMLPGVYGVRSEAAREIERLESVAPSFEITYVNPRKPTRIVGEEHFARSAAFFPVLQLAVGESAPTGRYTTAGFKSIKRVS